jgi:hypothetical protein
LVAPAGGKPAVYTHRDGHPSRTYVGAAPRTDPRPDVARRAGVDREQEREAAPTPRG